MSWIKKKKSAGQMIRHPPADVLLSDAVKEIVLGALFPVGQDAMAPTLLLG